MFTNFSGATIGYVTGSGPTLLNNQLVVVGGRLDVAGSVIVGWATNDYNNNGGGVYATNNTVAAMAGAAVTSSNLVVGRASGNAQTWIGDAFANGNQVLVSGATWTNWSWTIVGESIYPNSGNRRGYTASNVLAVLDGGTFYNGGDVIVGTGQFATANALVVSNGTFIATNGLTVLGLASATGSRFVLGGAGTATVSRLLINAGSSMTYLGGTLNVTGTFTNFDTAPLVVGDGAQAALFNVAGGFFTNGVTIAANATLRGNGTLTFAAGPLALAAGATYRFNISGVSVYDYLHVNGRMTISTATVALVGSPGDFNPASSYRWVAATATQGIGCAGPDQLQVVTNAFTPAANGEFNVYVGGGTNLIVQYGPAGDVSRWNAPAIGNWSATGNWDVPATAGGTRRLVFAGDAAYSATTDAGNPFVLNRLTFSNAVGLTLAGNPVQFSDGANQPQVRQDGAGAVALNGGAVLVTNIAAFGNTANALYLNAVTVGVGTTMVIGTRPVTLTGDTTVNVGPGNTLTITAAINGGGGLVLTNTGTFALLGANGYGGGTLALEVTHGAGNTTPTPFGTGQGYTVTVGGDARIDYKDNASGTRIGNLNITNATLRRRHSG